MSLDNDIRAEHFTYVDLRYAASDAMICRHCGSMCVDQSWKLHVVNCPALARWLNQELIARRYEKMEPLLESILRRGPRPEGYIDPKDRY